MIGEKYDEACQVFLDIALQDRFDGIDSQRKLIVWRGCSVVACDSVDERRRTR